MKEIENLLVEHGIENALVIRSIRDAATFSEQIGDAILKGTAVVVAPTRQALRRFHNTQGFRVAMNEIVDQFSDLEVVVEPGTCGNLHVAAFRPMHR